MAVRSLRLSYLVLAMLLCAMAGLLLRATNTDNQRRVVDAMLRQSAMVARHQVEAELQRHAEAALLAAGGGVYMPMPVKDKPVKDMPVPAGLLQHQGWLGIEARGPDGLLWRAIQDGTVAWPADPAGASLAWKEQSLMASSLRPARPGLAAHLLLHVPMPAGQDGEEPGVVTVVLPAAVLEQALREQMHLPGLRHRLMDGRGGAVASRGPALAAVPGGHEALEEMGGVLTGWRIATDVAEPQAAWMPQASGLTLAMGLALTLALMLVCVLAYQTRRGQVAQQMLSRALAESAAERRLADIAANLPGALFRITRSPDGVLDICYMSDGLTTLMGEPSGTLPQAALTRGLTPETRARVEAALSRSADTLTPLLAEFDYTTADGRRLWLRSMASANPGPDGSVVWDGVLLDCTEQRLAEERATLLAREVDHRAKNIMAVVRSLLLLTPRNVPPAQFVANLDGRLCAMARAHDLLAGQGWAGADLEAVVRREMATYESAEGGPRLAWNGPAVKLTPGSVQPVEMILHELATNAAKHGALSCPGGLVEVRWLAVAQGGLVLDWRESGGPEVQGEPGRQGFGFRLIHTLARHQLGGGATFLWSPGGLQCRVRLGAAAVAAIEAVSEPPMLADLPLEIPEPPARQAAVG